MTPAYHIDLQNLDRGISQLERFSWTGLLLHGKMSAYLKSAFRKFCVFFFVFGPVIRHEVKKLCDFKMRCMGFIATWKLYTRFLFQEAEEFIVGKAKYDENSSNFKYDKLHLLSRICKYWTRADKVI